MLQLIQQVPEELWGAKLALQVRMLVCLAKTKGHPGEIVANSGEPVVQSNPFCARKWGPVELVASHHERCMARQLAILTIRAITIVLQQTLEQLPKPS